MNDAIKNRQLDDSSQVAAEIMPAEFGLGMALFVVVASMVGAGILTTSGYTMATVGSNSYTMVLWVIGGVIAVCGALSLAELSATIPRTGGDYIYLYESYGPLAAFLSGWVSFLIGFSGPCATSAAAAAKYLAAPLGLEGGSAVLTQRILATVGVLLLSLIHVSGRRRTAHLQGWITTIKVAALVLFIIAGFAIGWPNSANLRDPVPVNAELIGASAFSLIYIYYAYTGWNGASYLAGEIRDPQRTLPRAILIGTGFVTILYLAMNFVYGLAVTPGDLQAMIKDPANKDGFDIVAPIAQIAASRLFGARWSNSLSFVIGLMLLSTLSAYLLIGPRVIYAMARARQFPTIAARLTTRAETPAIATLLQVIMTLVMVWVGSIEQIILYASVGLSLFSMLSISSIFILRWKRPDLPRPFRTPGYPVTPAIYLILTAILTTGAFRARPRESALALASILAGIPIYFIQKWLIGDDESASKTTAQL